MSCRLKNNVAVVTGSTGGIGEGIARALAAEGAAVVVSGRRTGQGEAVARDIREHGREALFVRADLAREADCRALIDAALEHFGRLDVLVNNAALFPSLPMEHVTPEQWDEVFAVNARGAFLCCQRAIPAMRQEGGGSIINIGTSVVYRGSAERLAYACSKGALLTMTKALARSYVQDRIRVNWVTVGWVATPGEVELRNELHGDGRAYLQEIAEQAPLGRLETVDDIAAGVIYLASEEASHVTGCELNVSGGLWV